MSFTPTDPAYRTDDPDELREIIEAERARVARLEGALHEIANNPPLSAEGCAEIASRALDGARARGAVGSDNTTGDSK